MRDRSRPTQRSWRAGLIVALFVGACSTARQDPLEETPRSIVEQRGVRYVFYLLHADAEEVASTLTELLQASRGATHARNIGYCALMTPEFWAAQKNGSLLERRETRILADPDTNSVLVIPSSDENDLVDRITELIHRLDVDLERPQPLR